MTITLTESQVDELGRELDAIRARIIADLGSEDRDYIYRVLKVQRGLEAGGRTALFASLLPPFWLAGTAMLSLSKILDNMEIGHNVMHGQYDWMRDPALNSKMFEWDTACPSDQWRHSHNYMHHTFTNILDKDRDIGYGILRMDEGQKWNPYYLGNPVWAFLLMTLFQYGVAVHDLEAENLVTGQRKMSENKELLDGIWRKIGKQTLKDYVLFPALTGPQFLSTLSANASANLVRNIWAYSIIFCGHFPSGVATFTEEETENEIAWTLVRAADARFGEHQRRQAVPHHVGQPVAPDRAPPVPGSACAALSGDRTRGEGALREVRAAVQHRSPVEAARLGLRQDRSARVAVRPRQVRRARGAYRPGCGCCRGLTSSGGQLRRTS